MRLFIALPLPREARRAARAAQQTLLAHVSAQRSVPMENFHITLRFIGESTDLVGAAAACAAAVRGIPPLSLTLEGYGCFAHAKSATAVLRVGGDLDELRLLHETLESALTAQGFGRGRKPLAPHVTLARGVDARALAALPPPPVTAFTASRLTLYESVNRGGRMVYLPLHEETL